MRSIVAAVVLTSLVAAAAAAQESTDIFLRVDNAGYYRRVQVGTPVVYYVGIYNDGPAVARNVSVTVTPPPESKRTRIESLPNCDGLQCAVGDVAPLNPRFFIVVEEFDRVMTISTTISVSTTSADRRPENNVVVAQTEIVEAPELWTTVDYIPAVEPGEPFRTAVTVYNGGIAPARDVLLELGLPPGARLTSVRPPPEWQCEASDAAFTCRSALLTPQREGRIVMEGIAPSSNDGGYAYFTGKVSSATPELEPSNNQVQGILTIHQLFIVSSADDSGPGTLRQALLDANAGCRPEGCRVRFRIPEKLRRDGYFTIQPLSPLPAITASLSVLAPGPELQRGIRPRPEVMLDGSRLASGNGLEVRGGGGTIAGLAIGNFPGAGVVVTGGSNRRIQHNFLGTDPTGNAAAPNLRGIEAQRSQQLAIFHNVVSGNRRSGILLEKIDRPQISENAVGLGSDGETPVPNGASGVYLGPGCDWAFVWLNDLAYNAHFGVAIDPTVRRVLLSTNAIYGNQQLGIDYGIDLVTDNVDDDAERLPNHPTITSARWDAAAGETVIEGRIDSRPAPFPYGDRFRAEIYADGGDNPQAREFLGTVSERTFRLAVRRDLRGKSITGITIRWRIQDPWDPYILSEETSEISPALPVE